MQLRTLPLWRIRLDHFRLHRPIPIVNHLLIWPHIVAMRQSGWKGSYESAMLHLQRLQQALDYPEFDVKVDRSRAQELGFSQHDVANDLLVSLVFANTDSQPMTKALQAQMRQFGANIDVLAPGAFLSLIVPLAVFFAFQRHFVQGLLAGSVK